MPMNIRLSTVYETRLRAGYLRSSSVKFAVVVINSSLNLQFDWLVEAVAAGDMDGRRVWLSVLEAVRELSNMAPGETVH